MGEKFRLTKQTQDRGRRRWGIESSFHVDNMTQRKWVEVILQKLVARGIALALDELPRRYVSREFLTL